MSCKLDYGALLTLLMVAVALCPAAANAQVTIGSITVTNEWQMGESDGSGAISGAAVSTTVDNIGGLNLSNVGPTDFPVYASPGAYSGSPLTVNFTNPASTGNYGSPLATQCLAYSNSGNFTSTAGPNWGLDFWVNFAALPADGVCDDLVMLGNNGANGGSNYTASLEIAVNNQGGQNGLYVSNDSGSASPYGNLSSFSANTWYHIVYVDNDGTGGAYIGTAAGWLNGGQPIVPEVNWGNGVAGANFSLGDMPANISVGGGWYNLDGSGYGFGLSGTIDELRFFSLTTPGVFNVADTDPTTAPPHNPGDANGDGKVDINDLNVVLGNYDKSTGMSWATGDFNGDGKVDINDLNTVLSTYDKTYAPAPAAVPEPSGLVLLLALAGTALLCWRRRDH